MLSLIDSYFHLLELVLTVPLTHAHTILSFYTRVCVFVYMTLEFCTCCAYVTQDLTNPIRALKW